MLLSSFLGEIHIYLLISEFLASPVGAYVILSQVPFDILQQSL